MTVTLEERVEALEELLLVQANPIGDMKWLKTITNMSYNTLNESVLTPHKRELEGHIAFYPPTKGKPWRFHKERMLEWLANNFENIEWGQGK